MCEKHKSYLRQDGSARKHPLPMDVQSGSVRQIHNMCYLAIPLLQCVCILIFLSSNENISITSNVYFEVATTFVVK